MKLNSNQKGWLASAIDGEGSITIDKKHKVYSLRVTNTNKEFVEYANKLFGERNNLYIDKRKIDGRKIMYVAHISNKKDVRKILKEIIPYLIIKKQQAIYLLEFTKNIRDYYMKCKLCNEKHYSKGYCIKHWYQNYGKEYHKKWRASKSLLTK